MVGQRRLFRSVLGHSSTLLILLGCPSFAEEAKYELSEPPLTILDRLAELHLGAVSPISEGERQMLEAAWGRKAAGSTGDSMGNDDLLTALLFASGVDDPVRQASYREKIKAITEEARNAVKGLTTPGEKGEALMRLLHSGVMANGYNLDQTSLSVLLDTGRYNCVSSTALYLLIGRELGFDLRPISIPSTGFLPGHASLDMLVDGIRIEVEPTNPDGFDWKAKASKPGVIILGFVPDRSKGHEVDGWGVAAMVYSNRGVAFGKENSPAGRLEALRCYLAALALDPGDETANNNFLSVFINWGPELAKAGKYEEGIGVLEFGQSVAPDNRSIDNNEALVWQQYVQSLLDAGKEEKALAVLRRAATSAVGSEFDDPGEWFCRSAEKRLKEGGWAAGLEAAQRALALLDKEEGKSIHDWRLEVYRRWSQTLLKNKDVAGSCEVLVQAYAEYPDDYETQAAIAYHTQESLRILDDPSEPGKLAEHFRWLRERFPTVKKVIDTASAHASRAVAKRTKEGRFEEALALVESYKPILVEGDGISEVLAEVYDDWARRLVTNNEWRAALEKYAEGLKRCAGNFRLKNNARATVDKWARPAQDAGDWAEAIRIYRIGLEYLPGDSHLERNLAYCEKKGSS